jgi:flagellar FliJ protein
MAKKFKLQPVLKHRGLLEDLARQRLAETMGQEKDLLDKISFQRGELKSLQTELIQHQSHGISVQDLLLYEGHIDHCGKALADLNRQHKHLQEAVSRCREALCQASQNKKLLENLKEKKMAEHRWHLLRMENRELDEIALQFRGEKS